MSLQKISEPFILVTTGGGGDGETVIDLVLQAYENDDRIPHPALLVLGPFMQSERQAEFLNRAARLKSVEAITFDAQLEHLMARSVGVVAMGGYNTFCEIFSISRRCSCRGRTRAWNNSSAPNGLANWVSRVSCIRTNPAITI